MRAFPFIFVSALRGTLICGTRVRQHGFRFLFLAVFLLLTVPEVCAAATPAAATPKVTDQANLTDLATLTAARTPASAACNPILAGSTPYVRPSMVPSPFRAWWLRALDIAVFCGLLAVGTWVVLTNRRRGWFFGLLLVSVAYLGFFRQGCVCPVGAIGNVAQAISREARVSLEIDSLPAASSITVPRLDGGGMLIPAPSRNRQAIPSCRSGILSIEAVLFFVLPLLLALLCGRVFCGTVCPLGAVQELLLRRPQPIPGRLDRLLRFGPWLMLGWALVSAFVWFGFPICRFDPFIPLFRLAEREPAAWGFTGAALLLCVFVSRPYCRWLCPYGVLLNLVSRLAVRRRTLDVGRCAGCRRCAGHCPVGAIAPPELDFGACIQCGRCSRACAAKAVR